MDINSGISITLPTELYASVQRVAEGEGMDEFVAKILRDWMQKEHHELAEYPLTKNFKEGFQMLSDMEKIALWLKTQEQKGLTLEKLWQQKQEKYQKHLEKLAAQDEAKLKRLLEI